MIPTSGYRFPEKIMIEQKHRMGWRFEQERFEQEPCRSGPVDLTVAFLLPAIHFAKVKSKTTLETDIY